MELFINYGMAWLSVLLMLLLSGKYLLRKLLTKNSASITLRWWNTLFRNTHNYLGILLIITGLIHGLNSSFSVLSLNFGTITCLVSILLGLNYLLRKQIRPWMQYHRILTFVMIVCLGIHLYEVGGIKVIKLINHNTTTNGNEDEANTKDEKEGILSSNSFGSNVQLKDGTFEGSARGFKSTITVRIIVKENQVTNISVTNIEDDYRYYSRAVSVIPSSIMDAQSLDVDTISGATYSSLGIINAVNDALNNALLTGKISKPLSLR